MRLLEYHPDDKSLTLTSPFSPKDIFYAILSHTWGHESDEVTFQDMMEGTGRDKIGYKKLLNMARKAWSHGLRYCWVDTCCIDKSNNTELSEAITSMFHWYERAAVCYVYLADMPHFTDESGDIMFNEQSFCKSRWFKRGWTLQELIAPRVVRFFDRNWSYLGGKKNLARLISIVTKIPKPVLQGARVNEYPIEERLSWSVDRQTTRIEDRAYCLLGLFGVFMPLIYGEGDNAYERLIDHIEAKEAKSNRRSALALRGSRR